MSKRAVVYVRVSGEKQATEEKLSVPAQTRLCQEYCERCGYEIVGIYQDTERYRSRGRLVQPSSTRKDRPAYQAMIEAGYKDEWDICVAWKQDRFGRGWGIEPLGTLLDKKPNLDAEAVEDTIDRRTLMLMAGVGKMALDDLRARIIMGRDEVARMGRWPGGPIRYGYAAIREEGKPGRRITINETEATWVRRIFKWYDESVPVQEIRDRLIRDGAPQRGNFKKPWSYGVIYAILRAPEYIGRGVWGRKKPPDQQIVIPFPPLVDKEQWDRVQAQLAEGDQRFRQSYRHTKYPYMLQRKLICSDCGHALKVHAQWTYKRKSDGKRVLRKTPNIYYVCHSSRQFPELYDCYRQFSFLDVEWRVWGKIMEALRQPELVLEQVERRAQTLLDEYEEDLTELRRLEKALADIPRQRQWLITQARKGYISQDDFAVQIKQLEAEERELQTHHREIKAIHEAAQEAESLIDYVEELLSNLEVRLLRLDLTWEEMRTTLDEEERLAVLAERKQIVDMLVERVLIDADGKMVIEGLLDGSKGVVIGSTQPMSP